MIYCTVPLSGSRQTLPARDIGVEGSERTLGVRKEVGEGEVEREGEGERVRGRLLGRAAVLSAPIDYGRGKSGGGHGALKRFGKKITLCTPYVIRAPGHSSAHA